MRRTIGTVLGAVMVGCGVVAADAGAVTVTQLKAKVKKLKRQRDIALDARDEARIDRDRARRAARTLRTERDTARAQLRPRRRRSPNSSRSRNQCLVCRRRSQRFRAEFPQQLGQCRSISSGRS